MYNYMYMYVIIYVHVQYVILFNKVSECVWDYLRLFYVQCLANKSFHIFLKHSINTLNKTTKSMRKLHVYIIIHVHIHIHSKGYDLICTHWYALLMKQMNHHKNEEEGTVMCTCIYSYVDQVKVL